MYRGEKFPDKKNNQQHKANNSEADRKYSRDNSNSSSDDRRRPDNYSNSYRYKDRNDRYRDMNDRYPDSNDSKEKYHDRDSHQLKKTKVSEEPSTKSNNWEKILSKLMEKKGESTDILKQANEYFTVIKAKEGITIPVLKLMMYIYRNHNGAFKQATEIFELAEQKQTQPNEIDDIFCAYLNLIFENKKYSLYIEKYDKYPWSETKYVLRNKGFAALNYIISCYHLRDLVNGTKHFDRICYSQDIDLDKKKWIIFYCFHLFWQYKDYPALDQAFSTASDKNYLAKNTFAVYLYANYEKSPKKIPQNIREIFSVDQIEIRNELIFEIIIKWCIDANDKLLFHCFKIGFINLGYLIDSRIIALAFIIWINQKNGIQNIPPILKKIEFNEQTIPIIRILMQYALLNKDSNFAEVIYRTVELKTKNEEFKAEITNLFFSALTIKETHHFTAQDFVDKNQITTSIGYASLMLMYIKHNKFQLSSNAFLKAENNNVLSANIVTLYLFSLYCQNEKKKIENIFYKMTDRNEYLNSDHIGIFILSHFNKEDHQRIIEVIELAKRKNIFCQIHADLIQTYAENNNLTIDTSAPKSSLPQMLKFSIEPKKFKNSNNSIFPFIEVDFLNQYNDSLQLLKDNYTLLIVQHLKNKIVKELTDLIGESEVDQQNISNNNQSNVSNTNVSNEQERNNDDKIGVEMHSEPETLIQSNFAINELTNQTIGKNTQLEQPIITNILDCQENTTPVKSAIKKNSLNYPGCFFQTPESINRASSIDHDEDNTEITMTSLSRFHQFILQNNKDSFQTNAFNFCKLHKLEYVTSASALIFIQETLIPDFKALVKKEITLNKLKYMTVEKAAEYFGENYQRLMILTSDRNLNLPLSILIKKGHESLIDADKDINMHSCNQIFKFLIKEKNNKLFLEFTKYIFKNRKNLNLTDKEKSHFFETLWGWVKEIMQKNSNDKQAIRICNKIYKHYFIFCLKSNNFDYIKKLFVIFKDAQKYLVDYINSGSYCKNIFEIIDVLSKTCNVQCIELLVNANLENSNNFTSVKQRLFELVKHQIFEKTQVLDNYNENMNLTINFANNDFLSLSHTLNKLYSKMNEVYKISNKDKVLSDSITELDYTNGLLEKFIIVINQKEELEQNQQQMEIDRELFTFYSNSM